MSIDPMFPRLRSHWFSLQSYSSGVGIQEKAWKKVCLDPQKVFVLGMEHENTLSVGLRLHKDPTVGHFLPHWPVAYPGRGGLLTLHNPGQLMVYPVVSLKYWKWGLRDFTKTLLEGTENFLQKYKIPCHVQKTEGVFTVRGKIAFLGLQVKSGVTQHGLAINVKNDLEVFKKIPSCGVKDQPMDQMVHYQEELDLKDLFNKWCYFFQKNLESQKRR